MKQPDSGYHQSRDTSNNGGANAYFFCAWHGKQRNWVAEGANIPSVFQRSLLHDAVGVYGDGVSNQFQHRNIGGGIRVGKTLGQVDVFRAANFSHGVSLGVTFEVIDYPACEMAIDGF